MNFKKVSINAFILSLALFVSGTLFAQENPASKESKDKPKNEEKQMSWEEFKADLQVKYQKVMDNVNQIQKEAAEKKIDAPEFNAHVARFEQQAKEFGMKMKESDQIAPEKQEAFKTEMKSRLERLNKSYEEINSKWAELNK